MNEHAAPLARRLEERERLQVGTDIQRRLGIKTSRDEPLGRFTTMRVGGKADLYAEVRNLFELRGIVRYARSRDLPLTLLGRGSDVVISDAGIGGLVVRSDTVHREQFGATVPCKPHLAKPLTLVRQAIPHWALWATPGARWTAACGDGTSCRGKRHAPPSPT